MKSSVFVTMTEPPQSVIFETSNQYTCVQAHLQIWNLQPHIQDVQRDLSVLSSQLRTAVSPKPTSIDHSPISNHAVLLLSHRPQGLPPIHVGRSATSQTIVHNVAYPKRMWRRRRRRASVDQWTPILWPSVWQGRLLIVICRMDIPNEPEVRNVSSSLCR